MRCHNVCLALIVLLSINFVIADVNIGNLSHVFQNDYFISDLVNGWINVSFDREEGSSLIRGFDKNISIKEFLELNDYNCAISEQCSCIPEDCNDRYLLSGGAKTSDTFSFDYFSSKLLALRFTGNVSGVNFFRFNVSSVSSRSCFVPFAVDLFDDGEYEFKFDKVSSDVCGLNIPKNCFNKNLARSQTKVSDLMCMRFNVLAAKGYILGANLKGNGTARFEMLMYSDGNENKCDFIANGNNEYKCNITLENILSGSIETEVCIRPDPDNVNEYFIDFEDNETCGYIENSNGDIYHHDFDLFLRPLMYDYVSNFRFDQSLFGDDLNLASEINNYIQTKYNSVCEPDCIVPIKLFSGVEQTITVNDFQLGYKSDGIDKPVVNNFYEVNKDDVLISSDFLILNIEKAGIKVPSTTGEKLFVLNIGNKQIKSKINVSKESIDIRDVIPKTVPLLVPTDFFVMIKGNRSYSYSWNFGDGIVLDSEERIVQHTYSKLGDFNLTITVSDGINESSKTFKIHVDTSYNAINKTIAKYKNNIKKVESQLNDIPPWIKNKIQEKIDLDSVKVSLGRLEEQYKDTFESEKEDLTKIMQELVSLKVPSDIASPSVVTNARVLQNEDRINPSFLKNLELGDVEGSDSDYKAAINIWTLNNIDINLDLKGYYVLYEREYEILFSLLKITLTPKKSIDNEFVFVIYGDTNKIILNGNYDEDDLDGGYAMRYQDMSEDSSKTYEFLYPSEIDIEDMPFYISPEFKVLIFSPDVGACNNNGKCEKNKGENKENCKNDCKSWGFVIILTIVLFIIAFIAYIILQEWYKRHYESHLFKDKNQLFNLMAFMSTAEVQSLDKDQIFNRLKPYRWNSEQLVYAWNKLHGKRTGMWEIPIFLPFEKKKVLEEVRKRQETKSNSILRGSQSDSSDETNVTNKKSEEIFSKKIKFGK